MNVIRNPRPLRVRSFGPVPTRIPICNTNALVVERGGGETIFTGCWASAGKAFVFYVEAASGRQGRIRLPAGEPGAYALVEAADGSVYAGGGVGSLFRLNPETLELETIREKVLRGIIWGGLATRGGHIYMQANPGEVIEYQIETGSFVLERHVPTEDSHYGHTWAELPDGRAVCGLSVPKAHLAVYRPGEGLEKLVPLDSAKGWCRIRGVDAAGRLVVTTGELALLRLDGSSLEIASTETLPEGLGDIQIRGDVEWAWNSADGRLYRGRSGEWQPAFDSAGSTGGRLALRPGGGVVGVTVGGEVSVYGVDGKLEHAWELDTAETGAMGIHGLCAAPGNRAFGSTFINQRFFTIDLGSGEASEIGLVHRSGGQTNCLLWHQGRVHLASYTQAEVHAYDPRKPYAIDANPERVFQCEHEQMRPISLVECAGALWMSTHAKYGVNGGALSRIAYLNGRVETRVHRNIVEKCNLEHLAPYPEKSLLLAGTSIHADCNSAPPEAPCAQLIIWDAAEDCRVACLGEELNRETLDVLAVTAGGLAPVFSGSDYWILDAIAQTLDGPREFPLGSCRHLTRFEDDRLLGSSGEDLFLWNVAADTLEVWPGEGGTCPAVIEEDGQRRLLLARPDATVRQIHLA